MILRSEYFNKMHKSSRNNRSNKSSGNNQNRVERKHKQQQNGLKPTRGGSIAILGDPMLKALNPSKLRRSTGIQIIVKTFPGATTSDMKYYVKPTLERNPASLLCYMLGQMISSKRNLGKLLMR